MKPAALLAISLSSLIGLVSCTSHDEPPSISINSSIKAYVTEPLTGLPAMKIFSAQANGLDRALIELIDSAKTTLAAAIYSFSLKTLVDAFERACQRHVRVRLILESESAKQSRSINTISCATIKLDQNSALMHEKFLVADRKTVWIGSHNWTCLDIYFDANNALLIYDASVANAFEVEFDEMFNGRFSIHKLDHDKKKFTIEGHVLELYFLPSDEAHDAVVEKIRAARSSIYVAMYAFTDNSLRQALLDAKERGVWVQAVWDYQGQFLTGSDVSAMLNRDVGVLEANPGLVHHKFAVIDEKIVITGSANWSRSGFEKNDENLLILENSEIARVYLAHWKGLYEDAFHYDREPLEVPRLSVRVFERSEGSRESGVRVEWRPHLVKPVETYELCRAKSSQGPCERTFSDLAPGSDFFIDTSANPNGTYYYRLRGRVGDRWSDYSNEYSNNSRESCHE
ncbi:hypothetical protein HYR54_15765 [Candidatus Acetothermia bacterium]|nr:hypothetical protein [Candidatus Acetothermia bacterium]MBI3460268.1 hypothetical protein [Candidatus Acetothermia bacterium]